MTQKLRNRLGFPGIVALLALFVALGGSSLAEPVRDAARRLVTGKEIKRGAIGTKHLSRKTRRALRGKRGPRGRAGSQGAAGATGANGLNGQQGPEGPAGEPGSDAASAFIGAFDYNPFSNNVFVAAATGVSDATPVGGSEAATAVDHYVGTPNASMVARQLRVDATVSAGSVAFALRVLRVGSSTPEDLLTCVITPANNSCDSGTNSATINPGDRVYMLATCSSATGTSPARFGWRATTAS